MGARIESAASWRAHRGLFARGALALTEIAARRCLDRGHRRPEDIDLLVNAGVYKDRSLAEPALAAIIQEDLGANPGHPARPHSHGTFSFDVLDGGCGALTALELADSLIRAGTSRLALIVAGDADPSPRTSHGFPFASAGGAVLVEPGEGGQGFERFAQRTFAEHAGLFEACVEWEAANPKARRGGNVLVVREDPAFADRAIACAVETTGAFLADLGLRGADVDLLVASQYPPRLADEVARAMAIPRERVAPGPGELGPAHTAGPIASLEAAIDSGAFALARNVLFVTAGAGITITVALYRR